MVRTIDDSDRISNKIAPTDYNDRTLLNALYVMNIADKIVNGDYRSRIYGGIEANKPATPEVREIYTVVETGYVAVEIFTSFGWLILRGVWSNADNRPPTAGLAPGSEGLNIASEEKEMWDGSVWRQA